jgi:hypothetical protein
MDARIDDLKARMAGILESHFENHQNPHETIVQMWMLLHTKIDSERATVVVDQTKH